MPYLTLVSKDRASAVKLSWILQQFYLFKSVYLHIFLSFNKTDILPVSKEEHRGRKLFSQFLFVYLCLVKIEITFWKLKT